MQHNGEHLPSEIVGDVVRAAGGNRGAAWWAGERGEGGSQLTDAAQDWIDEAANGEHVQPSR